MLDRERERPIKALFRLPAFYLKLLGIFLEVSRRDRSIYRSLLGPQRPRHKGYKAHARGPITLAFVYCSAARERHSRLLATRSILIFIAILYRGISSRRI